MKNRIALISFLSVILTVANSNEKQVFGRNNMSFEQFSKQPSEHISEKYKALVNDTIPSKNRDLPVTVAPEPYSGRGVYPMKSSSTYELDENKIYKVTDMPPSFPGGPEEMNKFIADNYNYPEEDDLNPTIEYRTSVTFVVRKTGEITDIKRKRDDARTDSLVAVVKRMPNWIPAKNNGKEVNALVSLPIVLN